MAMERDQVADDTLWCVNILGPDDVVPVATRAVAIQAAIRFNAWWVQFTAAKGLHPDDPTMWAVPTPWPHDAASHAAGLADVDGEYAWLTRAPPKGDQKYSWWTSPFEDGEYWRGPFKSRDEAIAAGAADAKEDSADQFFIAEADHVLLAPTFDAEGTAETLAENICESNVLAWGEDGPSDPWGEADLTALEVALQDAVAIWLLLHPTRGDMLNDWREFERIDAATLQAIPNE